MIVEALVTALVIAAGCNVYLLMCWWRASLMAAIYREQRNEALKHAREGLAAMNAAIRSNENMLRHAPRP